MARPDPTGVLLCPPDHFDVVDRKNPHMAAHVGRIDRAAARRQWDGLRRALEEAGLEVETIDAQPGLEDMVFAANQTFTGIDREGRRACVLSRMKHASRRREVPFYAEWFLRRGWRVVEATADFEGSGDAIGQPGTDRIWLGHGFRSSPEAAVLLRREFAADVRTLRLVDERFYHLDTALCCLDGESALYAPEAFDDEGRALLRRSIARLFEARDPFACNAVALRGRVVLLDRSAAATARLLEREGYEVRPVDTGEFLKSGGSAFCLKQWLW